jgi:hypothetical protein
VTVERRRTARVVPDAADPLARMRLRTGPELSVLDIGPLGALVEGTARLLPGASIEVHINTPAGRVLVRARVMRSAVSALASNLVRYRSALAFDAAIDLRPRYALSA